MTSLVTLQGRCGITGPVEEFVFEKDIAGIYLVSRETEYVFKDDGTYSHSFSKEVRFLCALTYRSGELINIECSGWCNGHGIMFYMRDNGQLRFSTGLRPYDCGSCGDITSHNDLKVFQ